MIDDDREENRVDRERIKELVDEAACGSIVVVEKDDIPVLGDIDPNERKVKATITTYHFGDLPDGSEFEGFE